MKKRKVSAKKTRGIKEAKKLLKNDDMEGKYNSLLTSVGNGRAYDAAVMLVTLKSNDIDIDKYMKIFEDNLDKAIDVGELLVNLKKISPKFLDMKYVAKFLEKEKAEELPNYLLPLDHLFSASRGLGDLQESGVIPGQHDDLVFEVLCKAPRNYSAAADICCILHKNGILDEECLRQIVESENFTPSIFRKGLVTLEKGYKLNKQNVRVLLANHTKDPKFAGKMVKGNAHISKSQYKEIIFNLINERSILPLTKTQVVADFSKNIESFKQALDDLAEEFITGYDEEPDRNVENGFKSPYEFALGALKAVKEVFSQNKESNPQMFYVLPNPATPLIKATQEKVEELSKLAESKAENFEEFEGDGENEDDGMKYN